MKKSIIALTLAATTTFGISATAQACSYSYVTDAQGNHFVSRTNELPMETEESLIVVPRGHEFRDSTAKYGFVGMRHGDTQMISSGLNEHGVNIEALGFWAAEYSDAKQGDATSLSIMSTMLGNAKSTDEAVEIAKKMVVVYEDMKQFNGVTVAFHYAINDGKRAVVIEHEGGEAVVYENTLGVMTNDPGYAAQEKMAKEAIEKSNARKGDDMQVFAGFDTSSEERFSRIAALNAAYENNAPANDARDEGLNRAFSMLNNMELVPGSMYWEFMSPLPQMIAYGNVVDIEDKAYYFRTYDNPSLRKIDLDDIDFDSVPYSASPIYGQQPTFNVLTAK
ncbi:linear amide C-N hydrolase [Agarivorans sp. B2Z047]|uniref:linear amide C-N hydrolase n=1 Tax=unclassified Agarivorans TaxID=2636026 RepID=UPI00128B35A1|nr:linear amide C-N hydrolase [Agarivorans sp. B2Z047]MPW28257.1 linear amide C-N hydrolase [Agarivorans sp. B2Z047]UQN43915.1 linear amide C-N hydrolase [Agarivorans sp. B2Z047]